MSEPTWWENQIARTENQLVARRPRPLSELAARVFDCLDPVACVVCGTELPVVYNYCVGDSGRLEPWCHRCTDGLLSLRLRTIEPFEMMLYEHNEPVPLEYLLEAA